MTLTHHDTHANGIRVQVNDYDGAGRDGETAARRLAASLPRGAPYVRKVTNAPVGTDLWVEPPQDADTDMMQYPCPDGFVITEIFHFSSGNVCITYEVDE